MAFEDNRTAFAQQHFTVIEIDLPVVNGECTLGGSDGYGTPLTCEQPSNGTFTHKFTLEDAPILTESNIWRCIKSISETPTELQSGRGLASRGSLNIKVNDFKGDPNPLAAGVTPEVAAKGTFFGKLDARNILQNREVRIKNYRVVDGVLPDLDTDAETRHYVIEGFKNDGRGSWTIKCKDELSRLNLDEKVWPVNDSYKLLGPLTTSTTYVAIEPDNVFSVNDVMRIGEELMTVISVVNASTVDVRSRGSVIGVPQFTNNLSKTETPSTHDTGDEVFKCVPFDGANIADVLSQILQDVGVDASYIPIADWYDEISEWHTNTTVKALYTEQNDVHKVISELLQSYLLDMWFDPVDQEIKLSAISVWKQSTASLAEGKEIDFDSVRRDEVDDLRATKAIVVYDKPYKSKDNSTENFIKASYYNNPTLATSDYYGEDKQKLFENNPIIDVTAGDLLVQRYVSRYGLTPQRYTWKTQERFLTYSTGDVVDIETSTKQSFTGEIAGIQRAQVISIKPNYNGIGRDYTVKALTYEPAFDTGSEIVIDINSTSQVNLYQRIGAPNTAISATFVFDGNTLGSNDTGVPSVLLGDFKSGSSIVIILANGAEVQGCGGKGGRGGGAYYDAEFGIWREQPPTVGEDGGTALDCGGANAAGVSVDVYFSGTTPSAAYPDADGYIRAPGGGGGAMPADVPNKTGSSGGGGAGRSAGEGGDVDNPSNELPLGNQGSAGNTTGSGGSGVDGSGDGGDWGQAGGNASSMGGAAGKGIVDSGATVVLYGETGRYINGNGDH